MYSFFNALTMTKIISKLILLTGLIFGIFTYGFSQQYYFNSEEFDNPADHNETINKMINTGTSLAASGNASNIARSMVNDAANQEIKHWLSRFGTAQVNVNLDKKFSLKESSLDWLLPWYDSASYIFFSQLGIRNKDSRNTLNIGAGVRTFQQSWMYGFNTFYDNDMTGHNHRLGVGAEAWTDYLQLSANGYFRLNGWHQSRDFVDYNERPASGGDIHAKAYLPALPQLGGKLKYEQYHGERVALFDKDNLQSNPYAVTAGLIYTPIPFITLGVDQRMGKSRQHETQWNLQMDYRLGESFRSQFSPAAVAGTRLLAESRYNLVERNPNIVLEYQKQNTFKLAFSPAVLSGLPGQVYSVGAQIQSQSALQRILWNDAQWVAAGGKLIPVSAIDYNVVLPPYKPMAAASRTAGKAGESEPAVNTYILSATAIDNRGNSSNPSTLTVIVQQPQFVITSEVTDDGALADGSTPITVKFTVTDSDSSPIVGQEGVITTSNGALPSKVTEKTDAQGVISIALTSTTVGVSVVTLDIQGQQSTTDVRFAVLPPDATNSSFNVSTADIVADGTMSSLLSFIPRNKNNEFVSGIKDLEFIQSGVSINIGTITENADDYTANVVGNSVGNVDITPQVDGVPFSSLQKTITLYPIPKITGIKVNGEQFATDKDFPKTTFSKATFQLVMNDDVANNTQYDWTSSYAASAPVDSQGKVNIAYKTYGSTVTVTAKSKKFPSYTATYQFKPNLWIYSGGQSLKTALEASKICHSTDFTALIESPRATNGSRSPDGTLWGEWGSLTTYDSPEWPSGNYWTKKTSTDFVAMDMSTGALQTTSVSSAYPLCAEPQ
ncbi:TPA: inverse autotransporter invasin Inv [Yersinia enterocolitica]|uniref:inverse autotransporter invasin Inv n=1 Tax=Yersinia enterocolitica TaxID=630 RepID=UPI001C6089D4|nr:inverse autotransporter invasin Inv [Yersinia enterocolitica]EKN3952751.1 invasin Inv [Yersinia enterocolitica]EKN4036525.1 invasin Inv [Yersinia enterocolitica]EKN4139411.1 invasin Inv [Yersinia enterocolitica]EKN5136818.1 Invasin [Yersinia enterocolitica]EKN6104883.1 Invasin [Yersinia enterocolitica]